MRLPVVAEQVRRARGRIWEDAEQERRELEQLALIQRWLVQRKRGTVGPLWIDAGVIWAVEIEGLGWHSRYRISWAELAEMVDAAERGLPAPIAAQMESGSSTGRRSDERRYGT